MSSHVSSRAAHHDRHLLLSLLARRCRHAQFYDRAAFIASGTNVTHSKSFPGNALPFPVPAPRLHLITASPLPQLASCLWPLAPDPCPLACWSVLHFDDSTAYSCIVR